MSTTPFPLPRFKREPEGVFSLHRHPPHHHPVPPPSLQMRVGGGESSPTTIHSPSLASNTSRRGVFSLFIHHTTTPFPLPRFKCESEGGIFSCHPPPSIPPPSHQTRVGGGCFHSSSTTPPPRSPFLASNASRRGRF